MKGILAGTNVTGTLLLAVTLSGCSVPPTFKLYIPHRYQEGNFYCGPASILMWRLYDGYPEVTQSSIAKYIGCSSTGGVSPEGIALGVNYFTATHDAFVDDYGGMGNPTDLEAQFFSRQITSLERRTPVIAIVEYGFHAGVINGGKWHRDKVSGYNVWDLVYLHDPDPVRGGPNQPYSSGEWTAGFVVLQVASTYAILNSQSNLALYGHRVIVPGRQDWPPQEEFPDP